MPTHSINISMSIRPYDFFYDKQMRRFLEQIVRAFSGFQYQIGPINGQPAQLRLVPCRMAHTDKMVASIIANGSTNTLNTVPMICVYMTQLNGRRQDVQNLDYAESVQVTERKIDPISGEYTNEKGLAYTVERLMPRPFEMMVNVDIWTSNQDQKHQLAEQILTIIYPDFTIQNSDNPLDWSAMTTMQVESINWSTRPIPIGTSDELDVMSISLKLPFWLNPPAKVMRQTLIHQVVTNINEGYFEHPNDDFPVENVPLTRIITTPGGHQVRVNGNKIILLGSKGSLHTPDGDVYEWAPLIEKYGDLRPGISKIRLKTTNDLDSTTGDLIGTVQVDTNNANQLFWTLDPDTLPANTKPPVLAVIDPRKTYPGNGLPAASIGQRYLIVHSITASTQAWGTLNGHENDIIQFNGSNWVVFTRPTPTSTEFVLNSETGRQLKWDGEQWSLTIEGDYHGGYWRIEL